MEKLSEISQQDNLHNAQKNGVLSQNVSNQVQNIVSFFCPINEIIKKRNENTFKQDDIILELDFDFYEDMRPGPDVDMPHKFELGIILRTMKNGSQVKTENGLYSIFSDHIFTFEEFKELLRNEIFTSFNNKNYNRYSDILIILKSAFDKIINSDCKNFGITIEEYFELELLRKKKIIANKTRF